VSAMLDRFLRHARRFGSEGVYEAAAAVLTTSELGALAAALDGNQRGPFAHRRDGGGGDGVRPVPAETRNACGSCGALLERRTRGPAPTFCSSSCRQRAYRLRART
jgi:hypothetical protein